MNRRQHRLGRLGLGFIAIVAMAFSGGVAFADDAPGKKAPAGKQMKLADDEIDPVAEEAPEVKAQKGIVVLERAGQAIGLGTVLAGDGRILTALSPLGSGNDIVARYADNTTSKLKLGHHDRAWDLALLVPQTGRWTEGLTSSPANPLREDATIRSFSSAGKSRPTAGPVDLRSKRSLIGGDDQTLENALEMGSKVNAKDIGSPLIDERGRVVGVLGKACMPIEGKPCAPVAYGVPVSAIKSFLKTVPPDAVAPTPWLGIQGSPESTPVVKGVRVLSVAKGSPASEAKLKGGEKGVGDMIVAVGGQPVTTPEELAAAVKKRAIGEKVPMTLFSKGLYKQVDVVLKAPPDTSKPAAALAPAPEKASSTNSTRTFKFATPPASQQKAAKLAEKIVDDEDPVKAAKKAISKAAKSDKKTKVKVQIEKDPFGDPD